jgi:hypothetical protein
VSKATDIARSERIGLTLPSLDPEYSLNVRPHGRAWRAFFESYGVRVCVYEGTMDGALELYDRLESALRGAEARHDQ